MSHFGAVGVKPRAGRHEINTPHQNRHPIAFTFSGSISPGFLSDLTAFKLSINLYASIGIILTNI
jgi:hypothetical protein